MRTNHKLFRHRLALAALSVAALCSVPTFAAESTITWSAPAAEVPAAAARPAAPAAPQAPTSCITKATASLGAAPPTLLIDGSGFCPAPTVLLGQPGGAFATLPVLASDSVTITADLTGHTAPATYVLLV